MGGSIESTRIQAMQEATINRVGRSLHSMTEMQLQQALQQTVMALQGSGGRVYLAAQNPDSIAQLYVSGEQPVLLKDGTLEPPIVKTRDSLFIGSTLAN